MSSAHLSPVKEYEETVRKAFRKLLSSDEFTQLIKLFSDHEMELDDYVYMSKENAPHVWAFNRNKYDTYCKITPNHNIDIYADVKLEIFVKNFDPDGVWAPMHTEHSVGVVLSKCLPIDRGDRNRLRDFFDVLEKVKRSQLLRKPLSIRRLDFEK